MVLVRVLGDGAWVDGCSGFFEVGGMGFGSLLVLWEDSIYLMNFLVVARGGAFLFQSDMTQSMFLIVIYT